MLLKPSLNFGVLPKITASCGVRIIAHRSGSRQVENRAEKWYRGAGSTQKNKLNIPICKYSVSMIRLEQKLNESPNSEDMFSMNIDF